MLKQNQNQKRNPNPNPNQNYPFLKRNPEDRELDQLLLEFRKDRLGVDLRARLKAPLSLTQFLTMKVPPYSSLDGVDGPTRLHEIMGNPGNTPDSIREVIKYILDRKVPLQKCNYEIMRLPPNKDDAEMVLSQQKIIFEQQKKTWFVHYHDYHEKGYEDVSEKPIKDKEQIAFLNDLVSKYKIHGGDHKVIHDSSANVQLESFADSYSQRSPIGLLNKEGESPLFHAIRKGNLYIPWFIANDHNDKLDQINWGEKNTKGQNVLHAVAMNIQRIGSYNLASEITGIKFVLKQSLEHGVDINKKDKDGRAPLDYLVGALGKEVNMKTASQKRILNIINIYILEGAVVDSTLQERYGSELDTLLEPYVTEKNLITKNSAAAEKTKEAKRLSQEFHRASTKEWDVASQLVHKFRELTACRDIIMDSLAVFEKEVDRLKPSLQEKGVWTEILKTTSETIKNSFNHVDWSDDKAVNANCKVARKQIRKMSKIISPKQYQNSSEVETMQRALDIAKTFSYEILNHTRKTNGVAKSLAPLIKKVEKAREGLNSLFKTLQKITHKPKEVTHFFKSLFHRNSSSTLFAKGRKVNNAEEFEETGSKKMKLEGKTRTDLAHEDMEPAPAVMRK